MRKILILAAPFALVACGDATTEEPAAEPAAVEEAAPAPTMVTANGTMPGTFSVTAGDGSITTSVLNGDGTFQSLDAEGAVVAEGTWTVAEGQTCFTANTEGAAAECWTETAPGADGSFTATNAAGETVTVAPQAPA